jgi:hypothetical protein
MSSPVMPATSLTFHGDNTLKQAMLERFRAHLEAGRVTSTLNTWNGQSGSVIGCAIESDDLDVWSSTLGLPKWLALLIDAIAAAQGSPQAFALAGLPTLQAIPVGVDLDAAGSGFVLKLLADIAARREATSPDTALPSALATVTTLHTAVADGKSSDAAAWRAARRAAMAVADTFEEHSAGRLLASVVEAAGWDIRSSPTVATDTMRAWVVAYGNYALVEFGWTPADEANVHVRLKEMHDRFLKDHPESTRTVFDHYAEQYPAEEERLRARIRTEREAVSRANAIASEILRASLAPASTA